MDEILWEQAKRRRPPGYLSLLAAPALGLLLLSAMRIATDPGDSMRAVDAGFSTEAGQHVLNGTVQNRTDERTYSRVRVRIELLDNGGNVVATTVATRSVLGPGESWTFQVPVTAARGGHPAAPRPQRSAAP